MVDSAHFVKSTPLRAFTESFQHFADMYVTGILKMCRKKFDAEKIFLDKLTGLLRLIVVSSYLWSHSEPLGQINKIIKHYIFKIFSMKNLMLRR